MKNQWRRVWPYALTVMIAGALLVLSPVNSWSRHLGDLHGNKAEDVRTTLHNLGSSNPIGTTNIAGGGTSEVCVFCHTPHGASKTNVGAAPLWNRLMPVAGTYSMYDAPNFDNVSTDGEPVGVSLACLSCHDGTIALDALINGPGSGQFFAGNLGSGGPGTSLGLIAKGTGDFIDAGDLTMDNTERTDTGANYELITGGASPFPNLTQDLTDDHPISMRMPIESEDPQFLNASKSLDGNIVLVERGPVYTDKRDAIRLYPASGGTTIASVDDGWVECASCHNPHAARPLFLRLPSPPGTASGTMVSTQTIDPGYGDAASQWGDDPNSGSAICLTCHDK